ncbi:MAG: hypothetical protein PF518_03975 [Spirochaetaceae bacterium]|jgi:hypothetical protein|nr:hypothetical protein [Spirochaetaceae bacterium]
MEHTKLLSIVIEKKFNETEFAINPNDAQDLNLFTRDNKMDVYAGQSIDKLNKGEGRLGEGEIHLLNECKTGTLMVSEKLFEKMNYSEEAIIIRNMDKIYLTYKV